MPAYWIGHVTISNPTAYEAYRQANAIAFAKYGARFLVRGGAQEVVEGTIRPRTVVIEFPDLKAAHKTATIPPNIKLPRPSGMGCRWRICALSKGMSKRDMTRPAKAFAGVQR